MFATKFINYNNKKVHLQHAAKRWRKAVDTIKIIKSLLVDQR